jgi:hypothetical protein
VQARDHRIGETGAREELECLLLGESREQQLGQVATLDRTRLVLPGCEEHRDRIRFEAARCEAQRIGRRGVDPVRVVHEAQNGPVVRRDREQAQRPGADQEARVDRLPEAERAAEGGRLALGDLVEEVLERPEQLVQRRERELGLGLDPAGAEDSHPGCPRLGVVEQRALADPRLAAEDQGAAVPRRGLREDHVDASSLGGATNEHSSIVSPRPSGVGISVGISLQRSETRIPTVEACLPPPRRKGFR